ncbi:hypothetical protein [Streptomyces asoensis]|uniref:Uncharacterized protein n=1 Tax=Streptomyces asoensis TaxID=249586 RepID=A0ABQ3SCI4_9ACTN|nr:hypothetical protein [Streptomyces asoensis]GGQ90712.1 hypothetical protein GCM10010496_64100 [Streptomyces asoensis]GHI65838.1 hypothetical protein Saso_74880 [Streptomyces asoensis]
MGVFELHPSGALAARAPEEAARRALLGEWSYRLPGGEALADVALRVRDFTTELARTVHELPPVPDASVTHWRGDGRHLRLSNWGQIAHLTGLPLAEGTS